MGNYQQYEDAHTFSDVDRGPNSLHHTLGNQPDQAASGNHNHDGKYAAPAHTHAEADVTNLTTDLAGKAATSHTHTKAQVTDFPHTHAEADVTNLATDLAGKSAVGHVHSELAEFTGVSTGSADAGKWLAIGRSSISAQYQDHECTVLIQGQGNGSTRHQTGLIKARIKQQAAMGSAPYTFLEVDELTQCQPSDFKIEVRTLSPTETLCFLWVRVPSTYESIAYVPLINYGWTFGNDDGALYVTPGGLSGSILGTPAGAYDYPAFKAKANAAQAIPSSSWQILSVPTEDYDQGGDFSANTFTAPVDGIYHFDVQIEWPAGTAGYRFMRFGVNGVGVPGRSGGIYNTTVQAFSLSGDFKLTAGDTVVVHVLQNSGASVSLNWATGGDTMSVFSGHLVKQLS